MVTTPEPSHYDVESGKEKHREDRHNYKKDDNKKKLR